MAYRKLAPYVANFGYVTDRSILAAPKVVFADAGGKETTHFVSPYGASVNDHRDFLAQNPMSADDKVEYKRALMRLAFPTTLHVVRENATRPGSKQFVSTMCLPPGERVVGALRSTRAAKDMAASARLRTQIGRLFARRARPVSHLNRARRERIARILTRTMNETRWRRASNAFARRCNTAVLE
jgi:hypothetical protein